MIPLLPPMTTETWNDYLKMYTSAVALLIVFGGLVAPALELRMGVGGQHFCHISGSIPVRITQPRLKSSEVIKVNHSPRFLTCRLI